jgi:hypothetical protein
MSLPILGNLGDLGVAPELNARVALEVGSPNATMPRPLTR